MATKYSPEISIGFQWTTRRYIPEDETLHTVSRLLIYSVVSWLLCYTNIFSEIMSTAPLITASISKHIWMNFKTEKCVLYWNLNSLFLNFFGNEDFSLTFISIGIATINKNTETLINAIKEVGLKINAEKIMHMLLSRHQNAGQNRDKR
jgi:hypothetical protein